jgi:hypothetical protein
MARGLRKATTWNFGDLQNMALQAPGRWRPIALHPALAMVHPAVTACGLTSVNQR